MQNKGYTEAYEDARTFVEFMGAMIEKAEQLAQKIKW